MRRHLQVCGARWCDHRPSSGDHPVTITECVETPQVRQKRCWGESLALCGLRCPCGAQLRDHLVDDDDHSVMITEYVETLQVRQKRHPGASLAPGGHKLMSGAHPCVHTRGSSDRQVVIASPVEPRRVRGNVAGESLWPCVSTNWCVEHDDVTTG